MVHVNQFREFLTPQLSLVTPGTPQRLFATEELLLVPSFLIEAPATNTGNMYLSDSPANMAALNRHTLAPNDLLTVINERWGNIRALFDLFHFYFDGDTGNKVWGFAVRGSFAPFFTKSFDPVDTVAGRWYHLVGVHTQPEIFLYVDGVLVDSDTKSLNTNQNNACIGVGGTCAASSGDLKGKVDHVRVYDRALSAAQVAAIYNDGVPNYGVIDSDETSTSEVWTVTVTFGGSEKTATLVSDSATI